MLTFSVSVTLLLLSVENPDEQSVSVGELGQEWISLPEAAVLPLVEPIMGLASWFGEESPWGALGKYK